MGCRKDVTRLLSAKGCSTRHHRGMDMLISNGGALEDAAPLFPSPLKAEVRHHGGDKPLIRKSLLFLKNRSPEEHHVITIHDPTPTIHGQHPIRIAIKGKTHHSALLFHGFLQRT
jgi:hypothetical protein